MSAKSQHNNILLAILGFTTVVIIVGLVGYFLFKEDPEVIQGSIEVSEYRVACKLPGRIVDLKVKEGDHVKKGDTLAILEIPEIDAQEKVAQATANATTALSDLTSAPTRSQTVESAYQIYQQAVGGQGGGREDLWPSEQALQRGRGIGPEARRGAGGPAGGRGTMCRHQGTMGTGQGGRARRVETAARQQAQAAKEAVKVVKSVLRETVQIATHDGEVSTIYPKVGELVGLGSPIMSVEMMDDMWGTFNVREDQLKGLKVGDTFSAYVPAFDKQIKMRVYAIKDQGSYAVWKATKTTGQYDLKTFEVKARPETKIDGLRPGMSIILKR